MTRALITVLVAIVAIAAGLFQFSIKPKLVTLGQGRAIIPKGNKKCETFPEVKACGKLVLLEPSGLVYMACSTPEHRSSWFPPTDRLNVSGKALSDYVAVYDPTTSKITKLNPSGYKYPRGLSLYGMDVVQSKERSSELVIYLVNLRNPLDPLKAEDVGTDSVVEIFRTEPGGTTMNFLATFKDPVISTPHDIVGTGDDKSFFFTNDHGTVKAGLSRLLDLDLWLNKRWSNVGYCHAIEGCKFALEGLPSASGIAMDSDGSIYVASSKFGQISVLERQSDNTLVVADIIQLDRPTEGLSVDKSGAVWAAGLPNAKHLFEVNLANPSTKSPSSALRITLNKGQSQYFGEKYAVDRMFEDDGSIASGSTSAAYDSQRKKLYIHGVSAPHLTVCEL